MPTGIAKNIEEQVMEQFSEYIAEVKLRLIAINELIDLETNGEQSETSSIQRVKISNTASQPKTYNWYDDDDD